jgi:hypothetical protein
MNTTRMAIELGRKKVYFVIPVYNFAIPVNRRLFQKVEELYSKTSARVLPKKNILVRKRANVLRCCIGIFE